MNSSEAVKQYWNTIAMATNKAKITFTCDPELKKQLQAWADSESRTLSNLCELLMQEAVVKQNKQTP